MGRPKGDQKYWNEVIVIEKNKKWKCKHCEGTYSGGFSRIKAHLDKTKGKGISKCSVYHRNQGTQHINTSNLIDPQAAMHTLNPFQVDEDIPGTSIEPSSLFGVLERSQEMTEGPHEMIDANTINYQNNTRLTSIEAEYRDLIVNSGDELPYSHAEDHDLNVKSPMSSNESSNDEFYENVEKMWEHLKDEKVLMIGIHGMGGVGKTFLATYMERHIQTQTDSTFKHVFRVTVSHDFTILKLQHHIAQVMGFKLDADYDDIGATILASELEKLGKAVLILDDVWKYIDLQKLGISLRPDGIKLIIITRLKHVCSQMDCPPDNIIEMLPSLWPEWKLFLIKLGHHGTPANLSPQVEKIARSLVRECDGLPLGINVMARTLRGRDDDIVWWRRALDQFENLEMGQEMTEEVLAVLKGSYDNLIEEDMQKSFLHFTLLPNYIDREELVRKLIERGVLNRKRYLREIFDEAHVIVDKLIDHSLLLVDEENEDGEIHMNGLVRKMAWHILKHSHSYHVMVKYGAPFLIKIPHLREWTIDLDAVSLTGNNIGEIPEGTSPNCPRLSTLILCDNWISHIPDSFFTYMTALTLLDLSYNTTLTCLPHSLSNLKSLTSLVLRECSNLKCIPPLGQLQALSTLDISRCSIHQVPEGLQNLINLKWLDLSGNQSSMMITVPGGVLSGLTNMQYLDLRECSGIKLEDVQGMTMLECFAGNFLDSGTHNRYVREIQDTDYGFETYLIYFGEFDDRETSYRRSMYSKLKHGKVKFGDCEETPYLLPRDLAKLSIRDNKQWVCLCSALSSNGFSSVKKIYIQYCTKLKSLFCLSSSCSLCTNIRNLEHLSLNYVESLTSICKEDVVDLPQSLSQSRVFSHLRNFSINGCDEIETLLRPELVRQLQNLESIYVERCHSMKEIFGVSSSNSYDNGLDTRLPKLTNLRLFDLPELKILCQGILICGSADILEKIYFCPKLEELPEIHLA